MTVLFAVTTCGYAYAQTGVNFVREPNRPRFGASALPTPEDWRLAPLQLTGDMTGGVGGLTGQIAPVILPTVHAEGGVTRRTDDGRAEFKGSARFTFAPKPQVGSAEAVADQIRLVGGTAVVNLGARLGWRWNAPDSAGTLGVQVRLGGQVGVQLADLSTTGADMMLRISSVGAPIARAELALGLWLYFAYFGGQVSLHALPQSVGSIQAALAVPTLQVMALLPIEALSSEKRVVYVQLSASGPATEFWRTLVLSFGARLEPF